MYSFKSRIRYSEVGQDKRLKPACLLDYFQDCSIFQSEENGLGIEYLEKEKQGWVLVSWQIVIEKLPELGSQVKVSTWPYDLECFIAKRNFLMQDEQGEILAYANSVWSFLDMKRMRPIKITKIQLQGYPLEEKLDMDYASRKIEITGNPCRKEPILITEERMDTNHHMNNAHYVRLGMECIPHGINIRQIRAEYKKAAVCDDIMIPVVYENKDRYIVSLENETEHPYAILEFQEGDQS